MIFLPDRSIICNVFDCVFNTLELCSFFAQMKWGSAWEKNNGSFLKKYEIYFTILQREIHENIQ